MFAFLGMIPTLGIGSVLSTGVGMTAQLAAANAQRNAAVRNMAYMQQQYQAQNVPNPNYYYQQGTTSVMANPVSGCGGAGGTSTSSMMVPTTGAGGTGTTTILRKPEEPVVLEEPTRSELDILLPGYRKGEY